MRMSKVETARTRERIVTAAAAKFRKRGIAVTGLADLMAAAGMTHGGFYRHFNSKDELVAETTATASQKLKGSLLLAAKGGIKSVVEKYLSMSHRDHPEHGCQLAALGSELARVVDDRKLSKSILRSAEASITD